MGSSSAPAARVGEPRAKPVPKDALLALIRRLAISVLVFGIPAYLVSDFLAELSGGALWLPATWRVTIKIFGLAAGLACFNLARHRARPEEWLPASLVEESAEPGSLGPEAFELDAKGRADDRAAQKGALAWYLVALVLLGLYTGLRTLTAVPWAPTVEVVETLYGDGDPNTPVDTSSFQAPVFLEHKGDGYHGAILVPLTSWLSETTRTKLDFYGRRAAGLPSIPAAGTPPVPIDVGLAVGFWLDHAPNELIDSLRADRMAVNFTVLLFLALHLAILCTASAGFGYAFSVLEELAGWAA